MDFNNSIEKTLDEIQKLMNTNSIVGEPIVTHDKTILPISKTALGFGIGVANKSDESKTDLGGVGGGGSIDPIALLIVYNNIPGPEGVELVRLDNQDTPLEDLLSGVGKTIFGLLENSNIKPASEAPADTNIDKIKTKIKPKQDKK
ncbi:MAG: hypothetical protein IJI98_06865 [Methanosphaera sp.]|nr:hypothetical protein [Methanosphaera sp.]